MNPKIESHRGIEIHEGPFPEILLEGRIPHEFIGQGQSMAESSSIAYPRYAWFAHHPYYKPALDMAVKKLKQLVDAEIEVLEKAGKTPIEIIASFSPLYEKLWEHQSSLYDRNNPDVGAGHYYSPIVKATIKWIAYRRKNQIKTEKE